MIGINTVISKYNVKKIPTIYEFVTKEIRPDSYICEVAEQRAKLYNLNLNITPKYENVLRFLIKKLKDQHDKNKTFNLKNKLRIEFYENLLSGKNIDCYCGFSSVNIMPNGDVWLCYVKKSNIGNLRKTNYNFEKIWLNKKAEKERERVKKCKYPCKLVNAFYTNFIFNKPFII